MTNQFLGKLYSEITDFTLKDSIERLGELISVSNCTGFPWDWNDDEEMSICIIGTSKGQLAKIDGKIMKQLEKAINTIINITDCYLYDSSTIDNPMPVIIKKNGNIYAVSPVIIIKK